MVETYKIYKGVEIREEAGFFVFVLPGGRTPETKVSDWERTKKLIDFRLQPIGRGKSKSNNSPQKSLFPLEEE